MAVRPKVEKCTDSQAQGGDKACEGGGRVLRHVEGGGGKKRLTFPGVEAAGDVELGALFFFGLVTKMARRLLWTYPLTSSQKRSTTDPLVQRSQI